MDNQLTTGEGQLLLACEQTIEGGLHKFYEVGKALLTICKFKLYRQTHGLSSLGFWDLGIVWGLGFGVWDLERKVSGNQHEPQSFYSQTETKGVKFSP